MRMLDRAAEQQFPYHPAEKGSTPSDYSDSGLCVEIQSTVRYTGFHYGCLWRFAPLSGKQGFIIGFCGDSLHCQVNRVSLLVFVEIRSTVR